MKQYVIDEIRPGEYEKLKNHMGSLFNQGPLEGVYRLAIPAPLLNATQNKHQTCGPFYFALELTDTRLCGELLVRAENMVRCHCIAYADEMQRNWLVSQMDAVFDELEISP